jgi:hypothetical protein
MFGRTVGLNLGFGFGDTSAAAENTIALDARTNLLLITSEMHQMFGRCTGQVQADDGEMIQIEGLIGFAEELHAHW